MTKRILNLILLCLAVAADSAGAQVVRGVVVEGGSGAPVEGAMVVLMELEGRIANRVLTDATGAFVADADRPGPHLVRVDRIGYESLTTERFDVPVEGTFQRIEVPIHAVELEGLSVEGSRRCALRDQQGPATARVWEEARKALEAAAWTQSSGVYRYTLLQFERRLDQQRRRVLSEERRFVRGTGRAPYVSVPVERLTETGFMQVNSDGSVTYFAPDAEAFLSDAFLDTHCMHLRDGEEGMLGLAFEPVRGRRVPEIRGTLWIETATAVLQRLEFSYVNRPFEHDVGEAGGEVAFGRLPNGTWVVRDWSVTMPVITTNPSRSRSYANSYEQEGGRLWRVLDREGSVVLEAASGTVAGSVVDSTGAGPAVGASVRVVAGEGEEAEAVAAIGEDGTFTFSGLPEGPQEIFLHHPSLDTMGLGPVTFHVDAVAGEITATDLRVPGVGEILETACAGAGIPDGPSTILFGRVRADGKPAAGATVRVRWLGFRERTISLFTHAAPARGEEEPPGWQRDLDDTNRLVTTLDERGVFMLCGVPRGAQVRIEAAAGEGGWTVRTVTLDPARELAFVSLPVRPGGRS